MIYYLTSGVFCYVKKVLIISSSLRGGIGGVNDAPKHADVMHRAYELGNKL